MAQTDLIIVVGGGIAGLAAAAHMGRAGLPVLVLEARNRIGGRIFTERDPACDAPLELGAEFIHGVIPDILDPLRDSAAPITELEGRSWCVSAGRLSGCDFFSQVDSILNSMDDSLPDESFMTFLERSFPNASNDARLDEVRRRAIGYVSGFNAADPELVGVHWLVAGMRAEEKNQGHRAFRSSKGYTDLLDIFQNRIAASNIKVQTGAPVERIAWKPGLAQVTVSSGTSTSTLAARQVLVTLPISLLKTSQGVGAVKFSPPLPQDKLAALDKLEMGKVIRIVLRFRHRFWETIAAPTDDSSGASTQTLADMSFLFSEDELFPTWWTRMPGREPLITGWAPFRSAEQLCGKDKSLITNQALQTLSRLLGVPMRNLEDWLADAYLHDWQTDPFSRGAYSYGKVGADGAQQSLARPVENTLFFAGEATDISGNNGTVHGAIASGYRAAAEIIRASRM